MAPQVGRRHSTRRPASGPLDSGTRSACSRSPPSSGTARGVDRASGIRRWGCLSRPPTVSVGAQEHLAGRSQRDELWRRRVIKGNVHETVDILLDGHRRVRLFRDVHDGESVPPVSRVDKRGRGRPIQRGECGRCTTCSTCSAMRRFSRPGPPQRHAPRTARSDTQSRSIPPRLQTACKQTGPRRPPVRKQTPARDGKSFLS
jgi:hypothetical protein